MSLEEKFIKDILSVLSCYEIKQQHITIEEAQTITTIRHLASNVLSLIKFRQELIHLIDKIPGRFFSFLPFVIDLRKDLRALMLDPQYSLESFFSYEATILREENRLLKSKLMHFESQSRTDHKQQSATDDDLYQKIAVLEKQFAQTNQLLRIENRELIQQLQQEQNKNAPLHEAVNNLQSKVVSAESTIGMLQKELLEKEAEFEQLRAENEMLKRELKKEGENKENKKYGFW